MGLAWQGNCESDTATLCKSNGRETFYTLSSMSWQGNGMGAALAWHAMFESALRETQVYILCHCAPWMGS